MFDRDFFYYLLLFVCLFGQRVRYLPGTADIQWNPYASAAIPHPFMLPLLPQLLQPSFIRTVLCRVAGMGMVRAHWVAPSAQCLSVVAPCISAGGHPDLLPLEGSWSLMLQLTAQSSPQAS